MRHILIYIIGIFLLTGCSQISGLEPEDQLYTGLKKIKYENYEDDDHATATKVELEASLAAAPNGALFGSSYYRTIFPYGLWVYNAFNKKEGKLAKWITKNFGTAPVIISDVNPALRASVAKSVLENYGYFQGKVLYNIVEGKPKTTKADSVARPRTAKIQYTINMGPEYKLDSISYLGFKDEAYKLICPPVVEGIENETTPLLHKGDPFDVTVLEAERNRINTVFRNHGYFFFDPSYISFQADTLQKKTKVQLRVVLSDSLPENAVTPYYIGKTRIELRNEFFEQLNDSLVRRFFTLVYNGKSSPVRAGVIFNNMKLRHGQTYSEEIYNRSYNNLTQTGIFSSVYFKFTPRKDAPDTLDMNVSLIIDKPYDVTLEGKFMGKSSGNLGPGLGVTFARRNAFHGGEVLSFGLGANYEFQSSKTNSGDGNTYDFTANLSLAIPRFIVPHFLVGKYRRWQTTPSTMINLSGELINRSGFFRRELLTLDYTYSFQPSIQSRHQFSPFILEYDHMAHVSEDYWEKVVKTPYLLSTLDDHFMTKMRYTYTYTSPTNYLNPIMFKASVTESGNILSLGFLAAGRKFNERDKEVANAPFAQFVKLDLEFLKKWRTGDFSTLLFHTAFGVMKTYGNTDEGDAPISEYYYAGGPSSIRAFSYRSIGPGSMYNSYSPMRFYTNSGDMSFLMNLEYRPRLFGSLYGAIFLDAGNVWSFGDYSYEPDPDDDPYEEEESKEILGFDKWTGHNSRMELKRFFRDLAVGVGVGIRYDLDFFVIRLDWGIALHAPYDTGRSGYFNMKNFKDAQCINFAIGYPF